VDSLAIVLDGFDQTSDGHSPSYIVTWGLVDPVQSRLKREVYQFIPMCVTNKVGGNLGTYTYVDWSGM